MEAWSHNHWAARKVPPLLFDSYPMIIITRYWVEFPGLYSRLLLVIYFIYGSVYMSTPIYQFIPNHRRMHILKDFFWTFLVVLWLRLRTSIAKGCGLHPWLGNQDPTCCSWQKRKVLLLNTEGIVSEKPELVGQSLLSTPRRMGVLGALEDIASPFKGKKVRSGGNQRQGSSWVFTAWSRKRLRRQLCL